MIRKSVTLLAMCVLVGCSEDSSSDPGSSSLLLNEDSFQTSTDALGGASLSFAVPANIASFQIVASSVGDFSSIEGLRPTSLRTAQGQDILDLSTATTAQSLANQLNPSSLNFPFLSGSTTAQQYEVRYQLTSRRSNTPIRLTVLSKRDTDLRNGTLRANFINLGPAANSVDLRNDLEGVTNIVKTIFSRVGILIDPEWYDLAGPNEAPDPRTGNPIYESISRAVRPYAVNVIFAARVRGLSGDDQYAVAGANPGPAIPSQRSVIVVDLLRVTGGNGIFETDGGSSSQRPSQHNDEPRLAAEEVARGISRYLGLEDIVTFRGSRVESSDSLSDTESCLTEEQCESSGAARSNVLMPRPLRDRNRGGRRFHPRDAFTEQQRVVLNNHILVD